MVIQVETGNAVTLKGRAIEVHEYSKDKAANITISVENRSKNKSAKPANIQTKCFTPAIYRAIKVGMFIEIHGHLVAGGYDKKSGERVYSQDVIVDYVEFLEAKAVVEAREAAKSAKPNAYAVDYGE